MSIALVIGGLILIFVLFRIARSRKPPVPPIAEDKEHDLLQGHVRFYQKLTAAEQAEFRQRVQHFLSTVTITPVGEVAITDLDKLYVAASAIIPIFSFKDWAYNNLNEVLIYPNAFTKDFSGKPAESNVLGMVGDGAMHRMMILTIGSLKAGYEQQSVHNTGIHEFVHLLDKSDGATDGIPEAMLPPELQQSWVEYMQRAIQEIRIGKGAIDPYAGTNEAEFFAVISEYFFQKPQYLEEYYPALWQMLQEIYQPATTGQKIPKV